MTLAQHMGYMIGYIILLGMAVGFTANFISLEDKFLVKLDHVEDSVVANRVVRCFSDEKEFGVINTAKLNDETLERCLGDKYLLNIKLTRTEGEDIRIETGTLGQARVVNRYVVADGKAAKLEVGYSLK